MDRFIDWLVGADVLLLFGLKSNMDRFIAIKKSFENGGLKSLKSNMDRFIVLFTMIHA